MFHVVYVIQSQQDKSLYIGCTSNLKKRISEHNMGMNISTRKQKPWELIFFEAYLSEKDARRREKYLKTNQGSRALKRMIKEFLLLKY